MLLKKLALLLAILWLGGCAVPLAEATGSTDANLETSYPAKKLADRLKKQSDAKAASDARLTRTLARLTPMLTPTQNQAFVRAFEAQADIVATNEAYMAAVVALDAELAGILADDERLEAVMNGIQGLVGTARGAFPAKIYSAADLYQGFVLLADSPLATNALRFAMMLLAKDPRLANVSFSNRDLVERIIAPALPNAYLTVLVDTKDDQKAAEALGDILKLAKGQCDQVSGWLWLQQTLRSKTDPSNLSIAGEKVGNALRTVSGLMIIWQLGIDVSQAKIDEALKTALLGGPSAVSSLVTSVTVVRKAILGIEAGPWTKKILQVSGRIGGGIGILASIFKTAQDAEQWDKGAPEKLHVAGDLLGVGAAIIGFSVEGPAGPVLGFMAIGVNLYADWLKEQQLSSDERKDLEACLPAAQIPAPLMRTMIGASLPQIETLTHTIGLSPQDLQWLMTVDEYAVAPNGSGVAPNYVGIEVAQRQFALDGPGVRALFGAVIGGEADAEKGRYMIDIFIMGLDYDGQWNANITKADALAYIQLQAKDTERNEFSGLRARAFQNAYGFLSLH